MEFRVIEAGELTSQRTASLAALATQSALLELNQLRGQPPGTVLTSAQLAEALHLHVGPDLMLPWLDPAQPNGKLVLPPAEDGSERATKVAKATLAEVNEAMKIACVHAIANLAHAEQSQAFSPRRIQHALHLK